MHLHILGICGTFMGGLAAIAREAGHRVTGCDANVYPPMSDQLRALGIDLVEGFDASQLDLRPDAWVIGNVVSRGNPLMEAILDARLPYVSGPQWLAEHVLARRHVLAVAGTHGKTTTASLLAWILEAAGRAPGFLIGGVPTNFPFSARAAAADAPFVIEADEYDTAFFDKRSKFVHYRPTTAILNNLEFDHADIFPDLAAIETQFHHLVRTVPRRGRLVVNGAQDSLARVLARGCWSERVEFDTEAGWHAANVAESADATEFDVMRGADRIGRCRMPLAGRHNRANAIAAIAAAEHVGVAPADAIDALGRFGGVRRRLEVRGTAGGVTVIDDFAHHPSAIETTIDGLRARLAPGERILAVVEPRSNTMKLGAMKALLPGSLAGAERTFCFAGGLGWDAAEALAPLGAKASVHHELDALVAAVVAEARPGDRVLVMSNGGFGGVHGRLLDALGRR
ncbi:MAG: UDP-N-acetylmuramate:L-alanyl-gamma-D-glutamyl-meso-diaminopimelate ligase [Burkholderiaceae bacterium]|jgi:UDP-N-acetylmuramate: L-alanyl-gamma-D-glutamyl-meso-diaminopimelate ligase|nr:UDP-N-acetylmuramate:L-alanyl-gamma-D-glutamyl-meso-diaminopimelate ligase [Burkholderiales bacterium]MCZ8104842.1 UDP-N-acetylmuramate:L-alanyl-gamma-D-glutamyl-meso-diaminopimelate ligase [Burkholderiales bacterium]MCZ8341092.1 UDP-N-acetylmuramate:L-alanyl-gamma-D-glutamyl-meso-diaminopimelate ligase [Burkholderiaceae bacterium]